MDFPRDYNVYFFGEGTYVIVVLARMLSLLDIVKISANLLLYLKVNRIGIEKRLLIYLLNSVL